MSDPIISCLESARSMIDAIALAQDERDALRADLAAAREELATTKVQNNARKALLESREEADAFRAKKLLELELAAHERDQANALAVTLQEQLGKATEELAAAREREAKLRAAWPVSGSARTVPDNSIVHTRSGDWLVNGKGGSHSTVTAAINAACGITEPTP